MKLKQGMCVCCVCMNEREGERERERERVHREKKLFYIFKKAASPFYDDDGRDFSSSEKKTCSPPAHKKVFLSAAYFPLCN